MNWDIFIMMERKITMNNFEYTEIKTIDIVEVDTPNYVNVNQMKQLALKSLLEKNEDFKTLIKKITEVANMGGIGYTTQSLTPHFKYVLTNYLGFNVKQNLDDDGLDDIEW